MERIRAPFYSTLSDLLRLTREKEPAHLVHEDAQVVMREPQKSAAALDDEELGCQGAFLLRDGPIALIDQHTHYLPAYPNHPSARADAISRLSGPHCSGSSRTYFPSDLERAARHQLAAPFTFILMAVTLSTGPVINKILSFRPANVLLVAPLPVGILRMLFPLGSKAITPCPLLI